MAYLLQRYLGNYVRGLNKEALKISVWQGPDRQSFFLSFFYLLFAFLTSVSFSNWD